MRLSFLLPAALCVSKALAQDPRSLQEIYEAAKKEGDSVFRVFAGGDQGNHYLTSAFKKRFPGIPFETHVDLSKYLDGRINRGYDEGRPVADAVVAQSVHDFPRWKKLGHLVPYKYINFTKITDAAKDPEGYYSPVSWNGFGAIAFDKTKCPETSIPNGYADFAKPEWKGKLILTYPNDDDAIGFLFAKTTKALGYGWLDGLADNDVQWVRGTGTPTSLLNKYHADANNKRCASFTAGPGADGWWGLATPGSPDNEMYWMQTAALLKGSRRPETQKLFMNYITSQTFDIYKETYVPQHGADWFHRLNANFSAFMADRAEAERWRFYFEDKFGTAQGPSPLVLYPDPNPNSP